MCFDANYTLRSSHVLMVYTIRRWAPPASFTRDESFFLEPLADGKPVLGDSESSGRHCDDNLTVREECGAPPLRRGRCNLMSKITLVQIWGTRCRFTQPSTTFIWKVEFSCLTRRFMLWSMDKWGLPSLPSIKSILLRGQQLYFVAKDLSL